VARSVRLQGIAPLQTAGAQPYCQFRYTPFGVCRHLPLQIGFPQPRIYSLIFECMLFSVAKHDFVYLKLVRTVQRPSKDPSPVDNVCALHVHVSPISFLQFNLVTGRMSAGQGTRLSRYMLPVAVSTYSVPFSKTTNQQCL